MFDDSRSFVGRAFLQSVYDIEFKAYLAEGRDAKSLAAALRRVPSAPESPAAQQFVERVAALIAETEAIRARERELNERLYDLYNLSTGERLLVERDCARRPLL